MSRWGEIVEKLLNSSGAESGPDYDGVRRRYLVGLHELTKRSIILYVTNCTSHVHVSGSITSIKDSASEYGRETCPFFAQINSQGFSGPFT